MKSLLTRARIAVALAASIFSLNSVSAETTITGGEAGIVVNNGWSGSGQSITVPNLDVFFHSMTVYATGQAAGQTFIFTIFDAMNGGSVLFGGVNMLVSSGANTVVINQAFAANSVIYAKFDYNGYSAESLFYGDDTYAGGVSSFGDVGSQSEFPPSDLMFNATFTSTSTSVPESSATLGLLGLGMLGLVGLRRRFAR